MKMNFWENKEKACGEMWIGKDRSFNIANTEERRMKNNEDRRWGNIIPLSFEAEAVLEAHCDSIFASTENNHILPTLSTLEIRKRRLVLTGLFNILGIPLSINFFTLSHTYK